MIALIQRVRSARVDVNEQNVGAISHGLLIFLGVEKDDDEGKSAQLARRVASYRVFADSEGKMNLDLRDSEGQALVVSQFTLAADTRKGRRPSFSSAATPEQAEQLYHHFCACMRAEGVPVETGQFAADMQVQLVNDGPVTFQLQV